MRSVSLLRKLLGFQSTRVKRVWIQDGSIHAEVEVTWKRPRCSSCGASKDKGPLATEERRWRHLDLGGAQLFVVYNLRRVHCADCGTVVELVPWSSDPRARFTDEFDDMVAALAQRCDKTAVQRLMRIAWRTVGRCVERVMRRLSPEDPLSGLTLRNPLNSCQTQAAHSQQRGGRGRVPCEGTRFHPGAGGWSSAASS